MSNLCFTVFQADCIGNAANCLYPHKVTVADEGSFRIAVAKDHVFAEYAGNYRSVANFVKSDALTVDCDNDHSDNPADWVQPTDVAAARFFFGTPEPEVELHEGSITLTQFLTEYGRSESDEAFDTEIPEGRRNTTLSRFAGRTLKRYGDTEEAYTRFLNEAQKCSIPLPEDELQTIWRSAESFFHSKVEKQDDYISPEVYNSVSATLRPGDYSDVGQAEVLAHEYGGELRYSPATDYISYNGVLWQESKPKAQAAAQELTTRQLHEVRLLAYQMWQMVEATGAADIIADKGICQLKNGSFQS